jgi:hypothetical protein
MGADIYLQSIFKPFMKKFSGIHFDPETDHPEDFMNAHFDALRSSGGYFRNGYNHGDVMYAMGLSWHDTVSPMLNKRGRLPVARARKLLAMIEARPISREHVVVLMTAGDDPHPGVTQLLRMVDEVAKETGVAVETSVEKPLDIDHVHGFLNTRRDQLLVILRKSIELNEPLYCEL